MVSLLFGVLLARGISRPLSRITAAMQRLAEGDKTIAVENAEQKNEIGDLARALGVFKDNAIEKDRLDAEQAKEQAVKEEQSLPIRLTPMTATCMVPPLSRVKLGIGWSRGVARDAEQ